VSLLENYDELSSFVKKSNWDNFKEIIDHYVNLKSEGKNFSEMYGVKKSLAILVDKFGTIQHIDESLKSEEKINDLLNQSTDEKIQFYNCVKLPVDFNADSVFIAELEVEDSTKDTISLLEVYNSIELPVNYNCSRDLVIISEYNVNNNLTELNMLNVKVELMLDYRINEVNTIINKIKEKIPDFENKTWITKRIKIMETFENFL